MSRELHGPRGAAGLKLPAASQFQSMWLCFSYCTTRAGDAWASSQGKVGHVARAACSDAAHSANDQHHTQADGLQEKDRAAIHPLVRAGSRGVLSPACHAWPRARSKSACRHRGNKTAPILTGSYQIADPEWTVCGCRSAELRGSNPWSLLRFGPGRRKQVKLDLQAMAVFTQIATHTQLAVCAVPASGLQSHAAALWLNNV